jgi:predicted RNA-binding protein YlxR (DUF448 family)
VRTCVGCRKRTAKRQLLRVVAGDEGSGRAVLPDPDGRAPGRGAYLHPTSECLELVIRRKAFPRALKVAGPLSGAPVEAYVTQQAHHPGTSGDVGGPPPARP